MDVPLALRLIQQQFLLERDLVPVIGAELECYLLDMEGKPASVTAEDVAQLAPDSTRLKVEKERGDGQWEFILPPSDDAAGFAARLEALRDAVVATAHRQGLKALFDAKPFPNQPGSGLHLHLSLNNAQQENQFFKKNEEFRPVFMHAIGGMVALMADSMPMFAPRAASYKRFDGSEQAPTKICWGMNNRTAALRIPESRSGFRTIEHRVPGADALITESILAVLAAVLHGIRLSIPAPEPVFGNAFLPLYQLPLLPKNLEEAFAAYQKGGVLEEFFGQEWGRR